MAAKTFNDFWGISKSASPPSQRKANAGDGMTYAGIQKLREEAQGLRARLSLQEQVAVAKKYEVLGKEPEELAKKLVDLKKAGGAAYSDYVALLDEQVSMIGKSDSLHQSGLDEWVPIEKAALDIAQRNPALTKAQAIVRAYETNPDLVAEYDRTYSGAPGRRA